MKHSAIYGDARQTTYFPGRPREDSADLLISRIGDTQGNGRFAVDFLTPYSWGLLGLEGEAQISMDGETHRLQEGSACLFRPDHKTSFQESASRPFRYLWFDIRGDSADALIDRLIDANHALVLRPRISGVLRRELELLRESFELETYSQVTQIASAWKILDCLCVGLGSSSVNVAHSCRVLIETEFLRGISVETIAQELKVSRSTLFRQFKAAYGVSPKEFIDELRIERACSLLSGSFLSIKEIVYHSGFNTPQNFYRIFKKHRGLRPTQLRQQQRS